MPGQGQPPFAITWEMITPCSTMCQVSSQTLAAIKNQNARVGSTAGVIRQSGMMSAPNGTIRSTSISRKITPSQNAVSSAPRLL